MPRGYAKKGRKPLPKWGKTNSRQRRKVRTRKQTRRAGRVVRNADRYVIGGTTKKHASRARRRKR